VSTLTSLARALAADRQVAQPACSVRHVHIAERPLIVIPLTLAGEANAPLAMMIGDNPDNPALLFVPEPRDRDQRFAFAAELAGILLSYIDSTDAPQLLVPNPGGVAFIRLLGRSTRFRRADGPYAVAPNVPVLGRWLTFFAERAEVPSSSLMRAMTEVLSMHWATGQSPVEDLNLAALLGWIDPPSGLTGAQAAAAAEDPVRCPPAGPTTDPTFDNEVLEQRIAAVRTGRLTGDVRASRRASAALADALESQLSPTWTLMWRAVDLLRAVPAGAHVAGRWASDQEAFARYATYLLEDGRPQPRRDSAVSAARRLASLEKIRAEYATQRAFDDALVMAEYRMTGAAFVGVVVHADPARLDESGKKAKLRPWIWVETSDEVTAGPGAELRSPARPAQKAMVIGVEPLQGQQEGRTLVTLELQNGMGRGLAPAPGSVPAADDVVCYTTLTLDFQPSPEFPSREDTPWTHGGPPPEYLPAEQDRTEPGGGGDWADDAYASEILAGGVAAERGTR
jgi:hypothetical protein